MSASPAKTTAVPNAPTRPGVPVATQSRPRERAPPSIFTQKKKKPLKKPLPNQRPGGPAQAPNGALSRAHTPSRMTNGVASAAAAAPEDTNFKEYPIYVSKDTLARNLHYHAMRFQARPTGDGIATVVNPYEEGQFTRPLHLHRRNARDKLELAEQSDAASGVDDKEREQMSIRRAERQAEREANQALIAPTGGDAKKPMKKKPQKKVEDVYFDENDPRQRARAQLRYEEARPWHLEDFDRKNIWVGSYEEPMSETNVMFEIGEHGFRMVPIEKWYKFQQTNRVKNVMDGDAAEKEMSKKFRAPRWFLGTQEANDQMRKHAAIMQREQQRARMRSADDDEASPFVKKEEYQADVDEIDFEFNDEFQDDDEGFVFGDPQDDEAKEIEKRIREEMRSANLAGTGVKDEDKDWDDEEQKERKAEQDEKRNTKRMRKQLIKKERKNEYDSDSDRGEFSESSESEDSEEERERLEEERKQEEARKLNDDKSGTSTKGTNTPTGRSEKKDTMRSLGASLKRPGSPDLSELSGNESSRKRAKVVNGRAISPNAPNGARSLSPDAAKSRLPGSGSGSDTDTSRAGRPKIRLKRSPEASPNGSRAASPSGTGSRAQSPKRLTLPSLEEVRAAIPDEGIDIKDLVKVFKQRVATRQGEFIASVKQVGRQDPASKKIIPRTDVEVGKLGMKAEGA